MQNIAVSNPAIFSPMSPSDILSMLSDCSMRKQPVVTATAEILQSRSWRNVQGAAVIDLSRMNSVHVDAVRKLALVGPGARFSSLVSEASKAGLMADIETPACLDFTFADWAHEPLRMLSTTNSGSDGVLRNVKVSAPAVCYQTGYDNFPANGGGYDLTKLFISSGMSLGIPTEFAIPLRPVPDIAVRRICSFGKVEDATSVGVKISRSGYARSIKLKSTGFDELLMTGKPQGQSGADCMLVIRLEGTKPLIDAGTKLVDELIAKSGGKTVEDKPDIPVFVDTKSISPSVWPLGICTVDSVALPNMLKGLTEISRKSNRAFQYSVSDIEPTTSVLMPLSQGPYSRELMDAIGTYLADARVALRGNSYWNPILGDARAVSRIEVVKGIKKLVDPNMILNPQMMEVF